MHERIILVNRKMRERIFSLRRRLSTAITQIGSRLAPDTGGVVLVAAAPPPNGLSISPRRTARSIIRNSISPSGFVPLAHFETSD